MVAVAVARSRSRSRFFQAERKQQRRIHAPTMTPSRTRDPPHCMRIHAHAQERHGFHLITSSSSSSAFPHHDSPPRNLSRSPRRPCATDLISRLDSRLLYHLYHHTLLTRPGFGFLFASPCCGHHTHRASSFSLNRSSLLSPPLPCVLEYAHIPTATPRSRSPSPHAARA